MELSKIMEQYNAKELTIEEANEHLKAYGISVSVRTEEELAAKRAEEQKGEFLDIGRSPLKLLEEPDMRRRKEMANDSEYQWTKRGKYEVFYNEDGYATKAVRV